MEARLACSGYERLQILAEFARLANGPVLLPIVATLFLESIISPAEIAGIDADRFILFLIAAPPPLGSIVDPSGHTGIEVDLLALTHADFIGARLPAVRNV